MARKKSIPDLTVHHHFSKKLTCLLNSFESAVQKDVFGTSPGGVKQLSSIAWDATVDGSSTVDIQNALLSVSP